MIPRHFKSVLLHGLMIWAVPFIVAMFILPLRQNERALFESIMPVVLATSVVVCSRRYFKKIERARWTEALAVGLWWLVISLALDALLFSRGPMAMTLVDYVKDIGVTYLMIPLIAVGFARHFS